jgi:hypothetical protein
VDIDSALRRIYPNAARWDYLVGIRGPRQQDSAVWLEVHPASSSHIGEVLSKLQWLKQWLAASAPELNQLRPRFCWVAAGTVSFRRGSQEEKRIAEVGLRFPVKHLNLESLVAD